MSHVDLPAYLVLEAAKTTVTTLAAAVEKRKAELRARLRLPRKTWLGERVFSGEQVEAALAHPSLQPALWRGLHDSYLRAYRLLTLAAAAVQAGLDGQVSVEADDLLAIKDAYFDAQALAALRLAALRQAKADAGTRLN
jgi:hypothetical protein